MQKTPETLRILLLSESAIQRAALLAERYGFVLLESNALLQADPVYLQWQDQTLSCCLPHDDGDACMSFDFIAGKNQHRRLFGGGRKQPLAKAVGIKAGYLPHVLDLTAGAGRDAFVLASLGCQVDMLERSPVIAALLDNALQRVAACAELQAIGDRMQLHFVDSREYLQQLQPDAYPDSIYLDPMYPERKKSALVKKEMRLLRRLVGHDDDSSDLLPLAMQRCKKRVAVKRPQTAPYLADIKPHVSINSPNTRYDIYMPRS